MDSTTFKRRKTPPYNLKRRKTPLAQPKRRFWGTHPPKRCFWGNPPPKIRFWGSPPPKRRFWGNPPPKRRKRIQRKVGEVLKGVFGSLGQEKRRELHYIQGKRRKSSPGERKRA